VREPRENREPRESREGREPREDGKRRRRRRRRGKRNEDGSYSQEPLQAGQSADQYSGDGDDGFEDDEAMEAGEVSTEARGEAREGGAEGDSEGARRKRRRGKRGGRRNRRDGEGEGAEARTGGDASLADEADFGSEEDEADGFAPEALEPQESGSAPQTATEPVREMPVSRPEPVAAPPAAAAATTSLAGESEAEAEARRARNTRRPRTPGESDGVETVSRQSEADKPDEEEKPRRSGWWAKGRGFF